MWDIENNLVLKLAEGKEIVRAFKGFTEVPLSQVYNIYGKPPIYDPLDYPNRSSQLKEQKGAHWTLMTYFDCCKVPIILKGIELIEQGVIKGKTNFEFAQDLLSTVTRQYAHYDEEQVYPIGDYGDFFPEMVRSPETYI